MRYPVFSYLCRDVTKLTNWVSAISYSANQNIYRYACVFGKIHNDSNRTDDTDSNKRYHRFVTFKSMPPTAMIDSVIIYPEFKCPCSSGSTIGRNLNSPVHNNTYSE
jgi:hypothetical protein